jgi:hypothetical protein
VVLANLVPGLRELRAPLAAGFLWIVVAWFAVVGEWPTAGSSDALPQRLEDARDFLGAPAAAAVLAFVAYLVGSVTADVTTAFLHGSAVSDEAQRAARELVSRTMERVGTKEETLVNATAQALPAMARSQFREFVSAEPRILSAPEFAEARNLFHAVEEASNVTRQGEIGWQLTGEHKPGESEWKLADGRTEPVNERGETEWELAVSGRSDDVRGLPQERAERILRLRDLVRGLADEFHVDGRDVRFMVVTGRMDVSSRVSNLLREAVTDELDLVMTRLLGEQDEMYGLIDRLRTEAELRVALIPPIIALATVGVVRGSLLWALLLLLAPVLYWQAKSRNQRANSTILDALALERVVAPTLERFVRAAEVEPERAGHVETDSAGARLPANAVPRVLHHEETPTSQRKD